MASLVVWCGSLAGLLFWRRRLWNLVSDTTLIGPAIWGVVAWSAAGLSSLLSVGQPASDRDVGMFLAGCLTLCPTLAVWGARRPHQIAWNWIVLSLWCVLVLPAAGVVLGRPVQLHVARQWFLTGLVALTWLHYLPTAFRWSHTALAAAQVLLLAPYLPWPDAELVQRVVRQLQGNSEARSLLLGMLVLAAIWGLQRGLPDRSQRSRFDRAWLDYRDLFGALWALRASERVNAVGRSLGGSFRLNWEGFRWTASGRASERASDHASDAARDAERDMTCEVCLRGILRRFVDRNWLLVRGFASDGEGD
jgi:hypothetical protein